LDMFQRRRGGRATKPPAMVVSAVSSGFVRAMGEKNGCQVFEALTGFKWIGTKALELREKHGLDVLFSYEEAIGFCVGDVICDKDGVSACSVFAEMYVHLVTKEKVTLVAKLDSLRKQYGYFMTHNGYVKTADSKSTFESIRNFGRYCLVVGSTNAKRFKVKRVRDLAKSSYLDTAEKDLHPTLPFSSLMITFYLEPLHPLPSGYEIRVTLRASGTEPKLKYYVEANGPQSTTAKQMALDVVESAVLGDLLRHPPAKVSSKL
jgi:phosphoglucomutase